MVFSYYLWKIPYSIVWEIKNFIKKNEDVVFYCADELDWIVFRNVYKHINNVSIVSKNKSVQSGLKKLGVESSLMPVFPKAVIMARHAFHKFPYKKIIKIGMRHGAYHFKKFIDASKYNAFDLFLFTSESELKQAKNFGITCGAVGGFPKLDQAFDGSITDDNIRKLKQKINIDPAKKTILFSTTWEKSGMSAVEKWYARLDELTSSYNIIVTLHPWVSKIIRQKIENTPNVSLIKTPEILPYLILSDIMVSDTSSIIAEFCALNKPIITFKIHSSYRLTKEVKSMIGEISEQINTFDELKSVLSEVLKNPSKKQEQRQVYNTIMFDKLDGKHARRMAKVLERCLKNNII